MDNLDEVDSKFEAKITFTSIATSDSEEVAEPIIKKVNTQETEALPQQTRFALVETLLSRCLPASNSAFGRVLATIIIITIIVLFELVLTSDYNTLKDLASSIINTLTKNETATTTTSTS
jgi:hypothetical protein